MENIFHIKVIFQSTIDRYFLLLLRFIKTLVIPIIFSLVQHPLHVHNSPSWTLMEIKINICGRKSNCCSLFVSRFRLRARTRRRKEARLTARGGVGRKWVCRGWLQREEREVVQRERQGIWQNVTCSSALAAHRPGRLCYYFISSWRHRHRERERVGD